MLENTWKDTHSKFKPNYSPIEMFKLGIFGGSYFNEPKILRKLKDVVPKKFLEEFTTEEISLLLENTYTKNINKWNVDSGSTYEDWLHRGWITYNDPYGWVNWYINFYYGRRCHEDYTQINRWASFIGRHTGTLKRTGNPKVLNHGFKTRQNMLHWAIDSTLV